MALKTRSRCVLPPPPQESLKKRKRFHKKLSARVEDMNSLEAIAEAMGIPRGRFQCNLSKQATLRSMRHTLSRVGLTTEYRPIRNKERILCQPDGLYLIFTRRTKKAKDYCMVAFIANRAMKFSDGHNSALVENASSTAFLRALVTVYDDEVFLGDVVFIYKVSSSA